MESEFHLSEYIAILKRRYIYMILPFLVVLGGSVAVAILMPPVYESSGTILIESPQIPDEMIRSTVTTAASERIEIIKQRVMTRANLYRIAEKFNIFRDDKEVDSTTKAVEKMREMAVVQFINTDGGRKRRGVTAIAFKVSFEHRRAEIAVRVANELVTLFLDENVKSRTERAGETTAFLSQESEKLEKSLQKIEDGIANYKQEHSTALPENLDLRLQIRDRSESEYKELDREIKALLEEKRFLEIEIAGLKAGYRTKLTAFEIPQKDEPRSLSQPGRQGAVSDLVRLKAELIEKSAVYGPSHPDVKTLKRKVAALEKEEGVTGERDVLEQNLSDLEAQLSQIRQRYGESHPDVRRLVKAVEGARAKLQGLPKDPVKEPVNTAQPEKPKAKTINPIMATVQAKLASANSRIESMKQQKKQLKAKVAEIETMIIQTPQVERALKVLNRDYDNAQRRYNEIHAKLMQAELSKSLEEERKAERFVLLEPPVMPEEPVRPNRKKMMALGFALSLAAGGGGIFLVEMIDGSIRGSASLAAVTKLQPLASIPYIVTTREARRRKRIKVVLALVLIMVVVAVLAAIHFYYMPLDIAFYKALARF